MVLLLGSLSIIACLLASCYAEVEEVATRGAPNPASRLPRMRPGGRAAPARNQYRMSYHAEEDPQQLRAQHQQQMMQQATKQPQRPHRPAQREDRKQRHAPAPMEQRGRPRPQQQGRQGQRQRGVGREIMVRTRRQQLERGPEVAVVRRRRKVPRGDEMGYEEERRPVAQRQPRRRPRTDGEHAGSPRRAFRHHQEDLMEAEYEMEQYEDDGYAQPRRRGAHRAQEQPEEDYGRPARRPQGGRGQRDMGPRDENEVMAEAIRLLQAQEGAGIGTPNNPFGLPMMDDEEEEQPAMEEEEEEEEVNDDFLVKPRKRERTERGKIRLDAPAIADDDGESDSLRIPMPDWMLYAGRIVDDASSHDHIFTTPDKVVQTNPVANAANVAKNDAETMPVVVKAEDEVAIPKRSFLKPANLGW